MNADGRAGGEGADHCDLVGRSFRDLLARSVDLHEGPTQIRQGRQFGELAQHVVEGVETVAHCDREQVGSVGVVEHVGVGLDHGIAWDRQADHGR